MNTFLFAVEEGPNNPILPVWNEVIWGSIAFFLLVIVMSKLAYPAVRKAMDDRTARIQGDLDNFLDFMLEEVANEYGLGITG